MSRQQPDARTALATRAENGGQASVNITDKIRGMEKHFQMAMPRGSEAVQLVRDALTALRTTKNLSRCEEASVLGSLMTCAQLGLRPGVLGHAWLLPFWDNRNRVHKAQLVIGYQGLVELAHRSGKISSLIARTVYAGDTFDVDYGLADSLVHKPELFEDRGDPIAYYAIAKFTSGGHAFVVMSHKDMLDYRSQHATARNKEGKIFGPWVDHFEGMAHKTCLRQLAKYMPKSTELAVALAVDDGIRVDLTPSMGAEQATTHVESDADDVLDGEVLAEPKPGDDDPMLAEESWPAVKPAGGAA